MVTNGACEKETKHVSVRKNHRSMEIGDQQRVQLRTAYVGIISQKGIAYWMSPLGKVCIPMCQYYAQVTHLIQSRAMLTLNIHSRPSRRKNNDTRSENKRTNVQLE